MASTIKRSDSIRATLTPAMKQRLLTVADTLGVPASSLASLAVGIYVSQQERALGMIDKMAETFSGQMGEEMKRQIGLFTKDNPDMHS